ncbi:hypothetical protein PPACK8108_LOCUS15810 [Phakopsora pachyrhizi]|uniref:Uncharacterized protein n=1 Tax=Phakopsora pachyrhizi TaxID=170000 RepID=A0AAV0B9C8_PHAPC|nr:hypothetical protein PPACK8108_LOCUS15810 [Phakopsora pachyrhizi]
MISNESNIFTNYFKISTRILSKMFALQTCFFLWLSPSLISRGRGMQGFSHMKSIGDKGEYPLLDSTSKNIEDFSNLQQNIHAYKSSHVAPPTYPVSMDFLNQNAEEFNNWEAEDFSLLHEWENPFSHPEPEIQLENQYNTQHKGNILSHSVRMIHQNLIDQPSNFQSLDYYLEDTWDFAPVEELTFSGPNHYKETHPRISFSKDQASSPIQPKFDGDLYGGNQINLVSNIDKFRYPDLSFVTENPQYIAIPHDEKITENPSINFLQNYHSISPQPSEMIYRVLDDYRNQNLNVLNINPSSSSHNSGLLIDKPEISHPKNSIDSNNLILGKSKRLKRKKNQKKIRKGEESDREKRDLLRILKEDFSTCSREAAQKFASGKQHGFMSARQLKQNQDKEAGYKTYIDSRVLNFINEYELKRGGKTKLHNERSLEKAEINLIGRRKTFRIIECVFRLQWDDCDLLKTAIHEFAHKFKNYEEATAHVLTPEHIKKISIIGITFMKIIASKYPKNSVSKNFGEDQSLQKYTVKFWEHCFTNHGDIKNGVKSFFKSIREDNSELDIDQIISTEFLRSKNTPVLMFSKIRHRITFKTGIDQIYLFSWFFCFFRTIIYYPELLLKTGCAPGMKLKRFIENGIMYFFQKEDTRL